MCDRRRPASLVLLLLLLLLLVLVYSGAEVSVDGVLYVLTSPGSETCSSQSANKCSGLTGLSPLLMYACSPVCDR